MGSFPDGRLYAALDATVLWNLFRMVHLSLVWRGRSMPPACKVLRHGSASVAFRDYRGVPGFAAWLLRGLGAVLLKGGAGPFPTDGKRLALGLPTPRCRRGGAW